MNRRIVAAGATVVAVAALTASAQGALDRQAVGQAPAAHRAAQRTIYLIPGISTDAFYTTMHKGAAAAAANSRPDWYRCAGSFAIAFISTASNAGGRPGTSSLTSGGG